MAERICNLAVFDRNGKVQRCGGTIKSVAIPRSFSPSSTPIGGPPEPPDHYEASCAKCGVKYASHM